MMLTERVGVVPGGVNIGVIRVDDSHCFMVDTGLNESNAKKTLKTIREELDSDIVGILTTHAHADHFGGNSAVVKRTGAKVWAPEVDEAIIRYPLLQPVLLFAGADPLDSLRNNFLLADPSPVDEIYAPGLTELEGVSIEIIALAGHSPNQLGLLVDGIFFCADVVLPESILAKYKIPYLHGVSAHLAALERAEQVICSKVVPGHGPVLDNLGPLIASNRRLVNTVAEEILAIAREPAGADEILTTILRRFGAPVTDASSYHLLHPTIFAFLSHLERSGNVSHEVIDAKSTWRAT